MIAVKIVFILDLGGATIKIGSQLHTLGLLIANLSFCLPLTYGPLIRVDLSHYMNIFVRFLMFE